MVNEYLHEVDKERNERIEWFVKQMKARVELTEELQTTEQMKWIGLMNSMRSAV